MECCKEAGPTEGTSLKGGGETGADRMDQEFKDLSEFHDQGDAKSIAIRRPLRGHNDTPLGQSAPGRPIGRPGVGRRQGVSGSLSYY
jgi:hypothetical protein